MDDVGAHGARAAVHDDPAGLEIVIPAPRIWPLIVFLVLWLAGWATGEIFTLQQILAPSPAPAKAFLAFWLAFWTFGGLAALATCAWMLVGHERLWLRPDALTIQREAFGLGPVATYALDRVRDLAAQTLTAPGQAARSMPALDGMSVLSGEVLKVVGVGGPGISFRYDGRPVRFGIALDPMEARLVVAQLQSRHPFADSRNAA